MIELIEPAFSMEDHEAFTAWSVVGRMGLRVTTTAEHRLFEEVAEVRHRHAAEPLYFLNRTTAGLVQLCAPTGRAALFATVALALAEVLRREECFAAAWDRSGTKAR